MTGGNDARAESQQSPRHRESHAARQWPGASIARESTNDAARLPARDARAHRHEEGMRSRPMWRVHRARERSAGELLSDPRRYARWRDDHHDRGPRHARHAASDAGRLRRARCLPVRVLHVGPDHVSCGLAQGALWPGGRGREGADERQHLPMRGVFEHRRRDPARSPDGLSTGLRAESPGAITMHTFEFIRPKSRSAAITVAASATTAQQGADIRFLAGGTTLLDLMKLNV